MPSCAGAWFDRAYPGAVHPEGPAVGGTTTVVHFVNIVMGFGRVELFLEERGSRLYLLIVFSREHITCE